jgi:hypothetical protein
MPLADAEQVIFEALSDTVAFAEPDILSKGEEDEELRFMAQHVLACLWAKGFVVKARDNKDSNGRGSEPS